MEKKEVAVLWYRIESESRKITLLSHSHLRSCNNIWQIVWCVNKRGSSVWSFVCSRRKRKKICKILEFPVIRAFHMVMNDSVNFKSKKLWPWNLVRGFSIINMLDLEHALLVRLASYLPFLSPKVKNKKCPFLKTEKHWRFTESAPVC